MPEDKKCPKCGAPMPADAPEGLCPKCLLALSISAPTEASGDVGPEGTKVAAKDMKSPPPISEIAPHFPQLEIIECLGRGGMGVVYKARQPKLNRLVALKILAREKERDPRFAERFLREAQASARLNHPNIVTVYDFGEADGLYFLLMEYVDGMNLRELLRSRNLTPDEALGVVPHICEALQYAHEQGIVHRDIKPENILLDKQGRLKIADFGIAKILGAGNQADEPLTGAQQSIGTPHYMAPEQVEKPATVDHRADIYSLGVVFYEMLTGELPLGKFAAPSKKVEVDVRLDEVVLHALEKEPSRRYQQASQVKTDVETIATTPLVAKGRGAVPPPPIGIPSAAPAQADGRAESHFSRAAIIAAIWAPFFLLFLIGFFGIREVVPVAANQPVASGPVWSKLALVLFLPLSLTAPFGTTILGCVAISQIRRSVGRLFGMGLALFDALLYPLLVLDLLIILAATLGMDAGIQMFLRPAWGSSPRPSEQAWYLAIALAGLLALFVDFLIFRAAWRVAHNGLDGALVKPRRFGFLKFAAASVFVIVLLAAIPVGITMAAYDSPVSSWFLTGGRGRVPAVQQKLAQEITRELARQELTGSPVSVKLSPPGYERGGAHFGNLTRRLTGDTTTTEQVYGGFNIRYTGGGRWSCTGWGSDYVSKISLDVDASAEMGLNFAPPFPTGITVRPPSPTTPALTPQQQIEFIEAQRAAALTSFTVSPSIPIPPTPRVSDPELQPEVLRAKIRAAEADVARLKTLADQKLAPESELLAAQDRLAELNAELVGDKVEAARLRFAASQRELDRITQLADQRLVPASDLESARATNEIRRVEWHAAQEAQGTRTRRFVRLVIGPGSLTFEGAATTWEKLPELLEKVTERSNTVLELAINSDSYTMGQIEALKQRPRQLVQQLGFDYLSFVGVEASDSKGASAPTGSAASASSMGTSAADLEARFSAAQSITHFTEKDAILAALARDAATVGNMKYVTVSLAAITSFPVRDNAASDVSRTLFGRGMRAEALQTAESMTQFTKKDIVLSDFAKSAASLKDLALVRRSLDGITSFTTKDSAAFECIVTLKRVGMRNEARTLVDKITNHTRQDQALSELAK